MSLLKYFKNPCVVILMMMPTMAYSAKCNSTLTECVEDGLRKIDEKLKKLDRTIANVVDSKLKGYPVIYTDIQIGGGINEDLLLIQCKRKAKEGGDNLSFSRAVAVTVKGNSGEKLAVLCFNK